VRNRGERGGPGKLRSYWEDRVHVVTDRKYADGPVYVVKPERGPGETRVLHRTFLLPCDFLPFDDVQQNESKTQSRRKVTVAKGKKDTHQVKAEMKEDSEDEDDWRGWTTLPKQQRAERKSRPRVEEDEFSSRAMEADLEQEPECEHVLPMEMCDEEDRKSEKSADDLEDENEVADGGQETSSGGANDISPASTHLPQRKYPFRLRHPPTTLTYDTLGTPSITHRVIRFHSCYGKWLNTVQRFIMKTKLMGLCLL